MDTNTAEPYLTQQEQTLVERGLCGGVTARALGLSFADRDVELIQYLKSVDSIPDTSELPTRQQCMDAFNVEDRWASMVLERVGQFMRKAARGNDYSKPYAHFGALPQVIALDPALKRLRVGVTFFIGDSGMDSRHWSSDAPYPVLVGWHLERLGRGTFVNAGIGGETAKQGLARFDRDVAGPAPVRTVIAFGGNDLSVKHTIPQVLDNIGELARRSAALGSAVVIQGVATPVRERLWWLGKLPEPAADRNGELDAAMKKMSTDIGAKFLDVRAILTDDDRCCDGIHTNQDGHEKIGAALLRLWAE